MSYTPENQLLEQPLFKLLEGIDDTCAAINERILNRREWTDSHIERITALRRQLLDLQPALVQLREATR